MALPDRRIVATIWDAGVEYEWDETKRRSNLAKHGVDFAQVSDFNWPLAVIQEDRRRNYGERRWNAVGTIGERVHTLVYTERIGRVRVISLRKSKKQEVDFYENQKEPDSTGT
ncbi:MAG TPA: BrnT family toxin [Acetobacteraceae bacterium]|nr:BrnT family toxin [Acetobacteraceae bacterium]